MTINNIFNRVAHKTKRYYKINTLHSIFEGHFPNTPIVPGVLLLRLIKEDLQDKLNMSVSLKRITNAKFLTMVSPKDNNLLEVDLSVERLGKELKCNAIIFQNNEKVLVFSGQYMVKA